MIIGDTQEIRNKKNALGFCSRRGVINGEVAGKWTVQARGKEGWLLVIFAAWKRFDADDSDLNNQRVNKFELFFGF